jgi:hypothetical protein
VDFEIVTGEVARGVRSYKYPQILELQVGQGLRLPWSDLSMGDPNGTVRTIAWLYGKKLPGRKFRTEKHTWGMLLLRVA